MAAGYASASAKRVDKQQFFRAGCNIGAGGAINRRGAAL